MYPGEPVILHDLVDLDTLLRIRVEHTVYQLLSAEFETFKDVDAALLGPLPDGVACFLNTGFLFVRLLIQVLSASFPDGVFAFLLDEAAELEIAIIVVIVSFSCDLPQMVAGAHGHVHDGTAPYVDEAWIVLLAGVFLGRDVGF